MRSFILPNDMESDNVSAIFGKHDEKTLTKLRDVGSRAEQVALMADGHVGYVMPIGGVAAYDNKASVVGVGFDIACGNAAIRTNLNIDSFDGAEFERLAERAVEPELGPVVVVHGSVVVGVGLGQRLHRGHHLLRADH